MSLGTPRVRSSSHDTYRKRAQPNAIIRPARVRPTMDARCVEIYGAAADVTTTPTRLFELRVLKSTRPLKSTTLIRQKGRPGSTEVRRVLTSEWSLTMPRTTHSTSPRRRSWQPTTRLILTKLASKGKCITQYNSVHLNNQTQKKHNKLAWSSRLLRHSVRKRGGLILPVSSTMQCTTTGTCVNGEVKAHTICRVESMETIKSRQSSVELNRS